MRKNASDLTRLFVLATLILLITFWAGCRSAAPALTPEQNEIKIVRRLPNGNYEVTPGFIEWTYRLKKENEELRRRGIRGE